MIIEIPGRPVAKQRARTVNGHTYTPPATREYEELVAWSATAQRARHTLTGDVLVSMTITTRKRLRGDIDNYEKAILDGLVKGGALADDRQVRELNCKLVEGDNDVVRVSLVEA